jgi:superfamily II DNA or RNA helicase
MRQEGFRGIVLVPASLRQQWAEELATRFSLEGTLADAAWLRDAGRSLPPDINPWSLPGIFLSSIDFVKRPEALGPLEDVRWDLVIVDEAHTATLSTDRRAAVDAIARRAHRVLLLTATPPGDPQQLLGLCRVGSLPGEADPPAFQRGRDVQSTNARRSVVIPVKLTDDEQQMHRVLERYTQLVWRARHPDARLVSIILRKRALSSASALVRSLQRRQDLLSGTVVLAQSQLLLPLSDEEDARDDDIADAELACWALDDRVAEERRLRESLEAALAAARRESKARVLVSFLARIREPAIVFTEYRDTLIWLHTLLTEANIHTCVVHGGLNATERRVALQAFRRGGTTLLATDAAAEGLNLHYQCRCVVHYELPWNPARLLQRVGRVDRIGQQQRVHELALIAADTAEGLVVAPFTRRATAWSDAIGRASLQWFTESRMADAVFDGVPPPSEDELRAVRIVTMDFRSDAIREAHRLEARRRLVSNRRTGMSPPSTHLACAVLKRSELPAGLVLIFEINVLHGRDIVDRSLAVLHYAVPVTSWPRSMADVRSRVANIVSSIRPVALSVAASLANDRANLIRDDVERALKRVAERAQSLQQASESAARQLVQAGLFERSRPRATPADCEPSLLRAADDQGASVEVGSAATLRALLVIPTR